MKTPKTKTTKKDRQVSREQIEAWAVTAVRSGGDDTKRQSALLLLLNEMTCAPGVEAANIALTARNAAFGAADFLIDEVIEHACESLRAGGAA